MKKRTFEKETIIQATPQEVFDWHMSGEALEQLLPPSEPVTVTGQPEDLTEDGARVTLRLSLLGPIGLDWVAEHRNIIDGQQFQDVQISGPFAHWEHTHGFEPAEGNATLLRDSIEYALPLGAVGDFVGNWIVQRKLRSMFEYRHRVTQEALE